ncbi:MAG: rod shape-determining protein MreD [Clostridiales bacterium]|nr:rod shape-determining protein MreD [Clostridiales bacterium]
MKVLICGFLTFFAMVLDGSFMIRIMPFGIHPSLLLALVMSFGICDAPFTAAMAGLFGGLMMDIMFGPALGYYAFLYMVTGYFASTLYVRLFQENVLFPSLMMAGAYGAKELLSYLFARFMGVQTESIFLILLRYILPSALLTGALGFLVYLGVRWLMNRSFMLTSRFRDLD